MQKLPFSAPKFSKFATIGGAAFLRDPDIKPTLPSNYSILYVLARVEKSQLKKAIAKGWITPTISREKAEAIRLGVFIPKKEKRRNINFNAIVQITGR